MRRKKRITRIIVPGRECKECIRRRCLEMPVIKEMSEGCDVTAMKMHGSAAYLQEMTRIIKKGMMDMAKEWSEHEQDMTIISEYFEDIEKVLMIYAELRHTTE